MPQAGYTTTRLQPTKQARILAFSQLHLRLVFDDDCLSWLGKTGLTFVLIFGYIDNFRGYKTIFLSFTATFTAGAAAGTVPTGARTARTIPAGPGAAAFTRTTSSLRAGIRVTGAAFLSPTGGIAY